jgi:hypothetical protein
MNGRRRPTRRRMLALGIAGASLLVGCARSRPPADTLTSSTLLRDTALYTTFVSEFGPTVFTDTALFRQVCSEADSGLTAKTAGKCTPRDQRVRLRRAAPRRDP